MAASVVALLACGASNEASEPAPTPRTNAIDTETSGGEPIEAAAPEPAEDIPMRTSGPAHITVTAQVRGESVAADVRLLGEDGTAIESKAGERISLQSGTYDLEVAVTDASKLADKPTERREVLIEAGADVDENVDFAWSRVQLNVKVNGDFDGNATVRLLRQGAPVTEVKSGSDYFMISPGRYKAEVMTRGAKIEVPELMFPEGATRDVPVSVAM
jgi:hypothetical protein